MTRLLLALFCFSGCANQEALKQHAYVVGSSSKLAVDGLYGAWDRRANAKISECVEKLPPAEHTKSEYDGCVGPFTEKVQARIVVLLEGVQAAQLVLFVTLSQDLSDVEVQQALRELIAAVSTLKTFIETHR
jgi:hypothetical protein